tara:strand:+ start:583 stop:729 length:147 start_codon:yes stop_codon:yes gene_type:complete
MAKRSKKYIASKKAELSKAYAELYAAEKAVARAEAEIAKLRTQARKGE